MVKNRNPTYSPVEHAMYLIHESSYASSSPSPHSLNFLMKHTHRLKCANMLQAEKTMKSQPGRVPSDSRCKSGTRTMTL